MELNKPYEFDGGIITIIREDVIVYKFTNQSRVTLDDMLNAQKKRQELIGEREFYAVVDCRDGFVNFTTEAKKWVAKETDSSKVRTMDLLLVNHWGNRLEAQIFLKLFKPKNKMKIALDEQEALGFIDKDIEKRKATPD